jgi:hypothetical protein
MQATEPVAEWLSGCRGAEGWRFPQVVYLMDITA